MSEMENERTLNYPNVQQPKDPVGRDSDLDKMLFQSEGNCRYEPTATQGIALRKR